MCGRITLTAEPRIIATQFGVATVPDLKPRYNISPSQPVATILARESGAQRILKMMRWGLIPSWAKDATIGNKMINARSETVTRKPAFRDAFRRRRCLIAADGFYEWARTGKRSQPYYFQLASRQPFGLAGLWERWRGPDGEDIESCTILTTGANALMAPIHQRMPVILAPDAYEEWLQTPAERAKELVASLGPCPDDWLRVHPVDPMVNRPDCDTPACIEAVAEGSEEADPAAAEDSSGQLDLFS